MGSPKKSRLNISFPPEVLEELKKFVPSGERSQLIVQATQQELKKRKLLLALKKAAGAWKDENHPELKTVDDIHRWLDQLRAPTEERLSELGKI